MQPSMIGAPVTPRWYGVPTIVRSSSMSFIAKVREIDSCSALRMFTAQTPLAWMCWYVRVALSMHTSTSIGSSESEVKEFAVIAQAPLVVGILMTVTPVAKVPIKRLKSIGSMGIGVLKGVVAYSGRAYL